MTSELVGGIAMLSLPMKKPEKPETFGEYVARHMREQRISQTDIESNAKDEAKKRGLNPDDYKISDATVSNIVNDKAGNMGMFKLIALSWGINRPLEEVVAKAFQLEAREDDFRQSEFFRLMDLNKQITRDEDRFYFARQIANLARDMEHAIENAPKKSRRSSG